MCQRGTHVANDLAIIIENQVAQPMFRKVSPNTCKYTQTGQPVRLSAVPVFAFIIIWRF